MKIIIEYCIKWNYRPEFDRVSNEIKKIISNVNIIDNPNPPRTGAFEITIDTKLVYSKFKTNNFPTINEIKSWF